MTDRGIKESELREFWERCGFRLDDDGDFQWWYLPDGSHLPLGESPQLDLNGLFKYAVPVAIKALQERSRQITPPMEISESTAFRELVEVWLAENPMQFGFEITLFKAIKRVIKEVEG